MDSVHRLSVVPTYDPRRLTSRGEPALSAAWQTRLASVYAAWAQAVQAVQVESACGGCLAVWLGPVIEQAVDAAWACAPEDGWWHHVVALDVCRDVVRVLLPGVAQAGCAPVPHWSPELGRALAAAGLPCAVPAAGSGDARADSAGAARGGALVPVRRYAVVTPYPFLGPCLGCALLRHCPRRA